MQNPKMKIIEMRLNKACSEVRTGRYLCDTFPVDCSLTRREVYCHCFSDLLYTTPLRRSRNPDGFNVHWDTTAFGLYWPFTSVGDIINNITTEALIDASKEIGRKVNAEKTKYMRCRQNAERNHNVNIALSRSFENVAEYRYLRTAVTN
jgi:hypothetical protein